MNRRSQLGRVRGLGAAKSGVSHWWAQRLTALALVPLAVWFVASVAALTGADHGAISAWAGSPLVAGLLILTILATFYHAYLGIQVVVEDYVHHEGAKIASLAALTLAVWALGVACVVAVLKVSIGS